MLVLEWSIEWPGYNGWQSRGDKIIYIIIWTTQSWDYARTVTQFRLYAHPWVMNFWQLQFWGSQS
jgi:hypothetical protein